MSDAVRHVSIRFTHIFRLLALDHIYHDTDSVDSDHGYKGNGLTFEQDKNGVSMKSADYDEPGVLPPPHPYKP